MQYSQKGFIGVQSSSPASALLTWDKEATRNPFMAIWLMLDTMIKKKTNAHIIKCFWNYADSFIMWKETAKDRL
jgi:hypothetical protein